MDQFIIDVLLFVTGWIAGINYFKFRIAAMILRAEKHPEEFENTLNQQKVSVIEIPLLYTETLENVILLYDKSDESFVCQGSSLEEMTDNLLSCRRFKIACIEHNNNTLWLFDGHLRDEEWMSANAYSRIEQT